MNNSHLCLNETDHSYEGKDSILAIFSTVVKAIKERRHKMAGMALVHPFLFLEALFIPMCLRDFSIQLLLFNCFVALLEVFLPVLYAGALHESPIIIEHNKDATVLRTFFYQVLSILWIVHTDCGRSAD